MLDFSGDSSKTHFALHPNSRQRPPLGNHLRDSMPEQATEQVARPHGQRRGHLSDAAGIQVQHHQHSSLASDVVWWAKVESPGSILVGSDTAVGTLSDCIPDVDHSVELNDAARARVGPPSCNIGSRPRAKVYRKIDVKRQTNQPRMTSVTS